MPPLAEKVGPDLPQVPVGVQHPRPLDDVMLAAKPSTMFLHSGEGVGGEGHAVRRKQRCDFRI